MTQLTIEANNIKCGGCADNIKKGFNELTEVESVEVNIDTGEITFSVNNITQAEIENKLSELGYPAK